MAGVAWSFLQRAAEMSRIKIGFRAIMGYLIEGFAALGGILDYARTLKIIPLLATTSFLLALTKLSTALPSPASSSLPPRPCVDFQTPVAVNTTNQKWKNLRADSNADAVEFLLDLETWSSPNLTQRNLEDIQVQQTFSISTRLCVPGIGKKKDILQIATHGVGFSKR